MKSHMLSCCTKGCIYEGCISLFEAILVISNLQLEFALQNLDRSRVREENLMAGIKDMLGSVKVVLGSRCISSGAWKNGNPIKLCKGLSLSEE